LFYLQFYHMHRFVVPALMYGSVDPGPNSSFDQMNRWASVHIVQYVEQGREDINVECDDPLIYVTNTIAGDFATAVLVRVPLASITSWDDLQRIVVKPLVALVQGEVDTAKDLLQGVETLSWPTGPAETDDEEDEIEQV
jgi:hypothetical protein